MMVKKLKFLIRTGAIILGLIASNGSSWAASTVTSVDYGGSPDAPEIKVQADGSFSAETLPGKSDLEWVVALTGAQVAKSVSLPIETSSLGGGVGSIQPSGDKIKIQLSQPGRLELVQSGSVLTIRVVKAQDKAVEGKDGAKEDDSEGKDDRISEALKNRSTQKFTGKPISIKLKDASLSDVFRLIGEASGFNVILGKGVDGRISLSLEDVPWDQALDIILRTQELGAERSNNILRIVTLRNITSEKEQELAASFAVKMSTPKVTRVFAISYATINELTTTLQRFLSSTTSSGAVAGASAASTDPAFIQFDRRTNSIIVHDIPDYVDRMKKLIEILDTPTPQVMVEAKVIEAQDKFIKNLQGSLGLGDSSVPVWGSFAGGNPIDALYGSPGVFSTGSSIAATSNAGGTFGSIGFSPNLSFINSTLRLNAVLGVGESDSEVKVMAAPKTVVLNRQTASILSSTPVLTPALATVPGTGAVPTLTVSQANLSLNVTPTVTNDSSVLMDLTVSKDVPVSVTGGAAVANRNLRTQVLVDSGTTLVIGGIYTIDTERLASGFPILRNIPFIGWLFGSESSTENRNEILIFVTPRILNSKELLKGGVG